MVESSEPLDPHRLTLRGGALCLDFVNTVDPRTGVNDVDYLGSYDALVAWGEHAGAVTEEAGRRLRRRARGDAQAAAAVLSAGLEFREALYRTFAQLAEERHPAAADLACVSRAVSAALARVQLVPDEDGHGALRYRLDWHPADDELDRVLWPVARSAADLLASPELSRVRVCAGDDCGWAFLDVSKNRSRRWCTMDVCGNRAKARRHYARTRRRAARARRR